MGTLWGAPDMHPASGALASVGLRGQALLGQAGHRPRTAVPGIAGGVCSPTPHGKAWQGTAVSGPVLGLNLEAEWLLEAREACASRGMLMSGHAGVGKGCVCV